MSEDQIATALGRIMGKLDSMQAEFRTYVERHDMVHSNHDDRHDIIDVKLDQHADAISQAKGAKALALIFAGAVGAVGGWIMKKMGL